MTRRFLVPLFLFTLSFQQQCVPPNYDSGWISMIANSGTASNIYRQLTHNLASLPGELTVTAKAIDGSNTGYNFNGMSIPQTDGTQDNYGGIAFGYGPAAVRLWAPSDSQGYLIHTGVDGWGGETNVQVSRSASIRVTAWIEDYSTADFDSGWVSMSKTTSYREIPHTMNDIPDRVKVLVRADSGNNQGYIFYGTGSTLKGSTSASKHGGIVFSYTTTEFRLYAPTGTNGYLLYLDSDWGNSNSAHLLTSASVRVLAWKRTPFPADYDSGWFPFSSQNGTNSHASRTHGLGVVPERVLVQVKSSTGRVYEGIGAAQATESFVIDTGDRKRQTILFQYGGVIYGYNENTVRLWTPDSNGGGSQGRITSVRDGWGGTQGNIADSSAQVRILAWKCYPHTAPCPAGTTKTQQGCVSCTCSAVGAISTQCDSNSACTCKAGFTGAKCDSCLANYFGSNCAACGCSAQSTSQQCNTNGQCSCSTGYTGLKCDTCAAGFFLSSGKCVTCNCNVGGSVSSSCSNGVCSCKAGFTGTKCDTCLSGYFGSNCHDCGCGIGATNSACDSNGNCNCNPNFSDNKCTTCSSTFHLSGSSCIACGCNPNGSVNLNCDLSGKCSCKSGFTGTKCNQCLAGFYGASCTQCIDCGRGKCQDTISGSGSCSCDVGWTNGPSGSCDTCASGRFGANCTLCNCGSGASSSNCDSQGVCNCLSGFNPPKCTGCNDGLFGNPCQDCNCDTQGSIGKTCDGLGRCSCKPSHTGDKCTICQPGYFGTNCDPCNCGVGAIGSTCDSNGKCTCSTGYSGNKCTICESGYFLSQSLCENCECNVIGSANTSCNSNGACSCKVGFKGEKCDECESEYYGPNCAPCINCGNGKCYDSTTGDGKCICNSSWLIGPTGKCDVCSPGRYGIDCNLLCECGQGSIGATCDSQGKCNCSSSYTGDKCNSCLDGFFGLSCDSCECGVGSNGKGCNSLGECNCDTGFDPPKCTSCSDTFFGPSCQPCNCGAGNIGNGTCDDNGKCICSPTFRGDKCDQCSEGFFLSSTTTSCESCNCGSGSLSLNCTIRGVCSCRPGFEEPKCSSCLPGYFGPNCDPCPNCGFRGICDAGIDGSGKCFCETRFKPGTSGKCDTCQDGFFGSDCSLPCYCGSGANGTACDSTGKCQCNSGFQPKCTSCQPGLFGPSCEPCDCGPGDLQGGVCSENGECTCGFNFKEPKCTNCKDGYFGPSCESCSCGVGDKGNGKCDSKGQCLCAEKFVGLQCSECVDQFFLSGSSCIGCNCSLGSFNQTCNSAGVCYCKPGYAEPKCDDCLLNRYGDSCLLCPDCENGKCNNGLQGNGRCTCNEGWAIRNGVCSACAPGRYGKDCSGVCPDCGKGICSEGLNGDGTCFCEFGWMNGISNFCSVPSPGFSLAGGNSISCHPTCSSCFGLSSNQCSGCKSSLSFDAIFFNCSSNCNPRFYFDGNNCQSCHSSCETCYGGSVNECLSCPVGKILENGQCVSSCQRESSIVENGRCFGCSINCQTCQNRNTNGCLTCRNDLVLDRGECVRTCKSNSSYVDSSNNCQTCHPTCQRCSGPLAKDCLECFPGFSLYEGECISSCPSHFYPDSNGNCIECNELCDECFGPGIFRCSSCKDGPFPYLDGFACVSRCGQFKYVPPGKKECITCNCNSHSSSCDDSGKCLDCKDNTSGRNCESCKDGFYRPSNIGSSGPCSACECNGRATNCDSEGKCLECLSNTEGDKCQNCKENFEWSSDGESCVVSSGNKLNSLSSSIIGLIVALILLLLLLFGSFAYFWMRRRQTKKNGQGFEGEITLVSTTLKEFERFSVYRGEDSTIMNTLNGNEISLPGYLKVKEEEIVIEKEIASGKDGKIYFGSVQNPDIRARFPQICDNLAIKFIDQQLDLTNEENTAAFRQEVSVVNAFSSHPNIILIVAYCENPNYFITPLYQGDLSSLIHNKEITYGSLEIMDMMQHMASAFEMIHSFGVAHRDIKPHNILLEKRAAPINHKIVGEWSNFSFRLKICDFGVCFVNNSNPLVTNQTLLNVFGLTPRYAAPEVFSRLCLSHFPGTLQDFQMADVYSFSITLWELFHRQLPWKNQESQIKDLVISGRRPTIDQNDKSQFQEKEKSRETLDLFIHSSIESGWLPDPTQRYSFASLHKRLKDCF